MNPTTYSISQNQDGKIILTGNTEFNNVAALKDYLAQIELELPIEIKVVSILNMKKNDKIARKQAIWSYLTPQ
jgi:hypothetical protein